MRDAQQPDDPGRGDDRPAVDLAAGVSDLVKAVDRGISKEVSPYDLTSLEFNVLKICLEEEGERTATQLARALPVDGARISRLVSGLVDKGLLRRRRLRSDRRVVMLSLTEAGRALTAQAVRSVRRYEAGLLEGVGEAEAQGFLAVIARIVANHAAMEGAE